MAKLRVLSGREGLKILSEFGFRSYWQKGSHVKVRRVVAGAGRSEGGGGYGDESVREIRL